MQVRKRPPAGRRVAALVGALAVLAALAIPSSGAALSVGGKTSAPPMLAPAARGVSVEPIISVGDTLPGGYMFESIPDGIALRPNADLTTATVWVNHETSLVPFPIRTPPALSESDFKNAELSELVLSREDAGVLSGRYAIPSSANYQRFCSNFLAERIHGFERPLLFTNEESSDFVNRTGQAWPPGPNAEQAGVVVAYDPGTGEYRSIYGMGRMNHENAVALPHYGHPVVLTGDDTFTAPSSQLYLYSADSANAVWNDEGTLYAFKSDDPAVNDYGDLSGDEEISGSFIPVPRSVALGDQTALENWSNANNVFQFIRVEDIAYDKRTSRFEDRVVYFADTGEPRALPDPATTRLRRGPAGTAGPWPNGRVFRMVLDAGDPLRVKSLTIAIDGDVKGAASAGDPALIHNPDNLETFGFNLFVQEDPGTQNQYAPSDPNGTTARVWRYGLDGGGLSVIARVDQSLDPAAPLGAWESSGIVDASRVFGRGAFLLDVQAHTLWIERLVVGNTVFKREAGQLLLLRYGRGG